MKKWEYTVTEEFDSSPEADEMGERGWELAGFTLTGDMWWKREKSFSNLDAIDQSLTLKCE